MSETSSSSTPSAPASDRPAGGSHSSGPRSGGRPGYGSRPQGAGGRPQGGPGGPGGRGRRPPQRRKVCRFCAEKIRDVDYKALPILRGFLTPRGKILSGRATGNCAKHQRQLTTAIKRAQTLALLPYTGE
jgi:small subunit ribosomal protein S18